MNQQHGQPLGVYTGALHKVHNYKYRSQTHDPRDQNNKNANVSIATRNDTTTPFPTSPTKGSERTSIFYSIQYSMLCCWPVSLHMGSFPLFREYRFEGTRTHPQSVEYYRIIYNIIIFDAQSLKNPERRHVYFISRVDDASDVITLEKLN